MIGRTVVGDRAIISLKSWWSSKRGVTQCRRIFVSCVWALAVQIPVYIMSSTVRPVSCVGHTFVPFVGERTLIAFCVLTMEGRVVKCGRCSQRKFIVGSNTLCVECGRWVCKACTEEVGWPAWCLECEKEPCHIRLGELTCSYRCGVCRNICPMNWNRLFDNCTDCIAHCCPECATKFRPGFVTCRSCK